MFWCPNTPHLFSHSHFDGHLGCFYLVTIMNNAAMNICIKVSVGTFPLHLDTYLGMGLWGHVGALCLFIWGTVRLFSKTAALFYKPTSTIWRFRFLHIMATCYFRVCVCACTCVFTVASLVDMKWYLIVCLICISLMMLNISSCGYCYLSSFILIAINLIYVSYYHI